MLIDLELYEINVILKALGEQPYNKVAFVIQDIKEQVEKYQNN